MLRYVSKIEQKEYSRIQHDALDDTIDVLITAASAAVKNYLGDFSPYEGVRNDDDDFVVDSNYEPEQALDSSGLQVIRAEVRMAVLYLVDVWLKSKEAPQESGYLPVTVKALLYPLRDPVVK